MAEGHLMFRAEYSSNEFSFMNYGLLPG